MGVLVLYAVCPACGESRDFDFHNDAIVGRWRHGEKVVAGERKCKPRCWVYCTCGSKLFADAIIKANVLNGAGHNVRLADDTVDEQKKDRSQRCAGCGQPIGDESYHWHLGDLYHDRCEMSTGMICTGCGESIRCGETYHRHLGRAYHDDCRRDREKKHVLRCKCKAIEELAVRLDNHEAEERMADDSGVEPIGLFDRALRERLAKNEPNCDLEMVAEMKEIIRLHDGHKFSVLAEQYNAFDDAIDPVGDYYVSRLNVADLLDEILCKYVGDWVRSRRD